MSGDVEEIIRSGKVSESLFSLEVIVEKLTAPSIVCRFPAVAFRLLDFPTLIIYHVEQDLAETIKSKVQADPMYKIPPQFRELKDRKNYFILKKGKSCLFKISPQNLHAHLMNTPLYMMLIDTFPEVPKLLGNCAIPLDDVMDLIYKDINHLGVSVPSAHGQKGDYKLFNLMGAEIGEVSLGFRLLSLGMGLIQHIPDAAISTYKPKTVENASGSSKAQQREERVKAVDKTTEMILQSIEAADKDIQVAASDFLPLMEDMNTQTEKEIESARMANSFMQTEELEKKKSSTRQKKRQKIHSDPYTKVSEEMNGFFVTNMSCPPPLFYNSEAVDPVLYEGLTFNDNKFSGFEAPAPNYAWKSDDSDDSFSTNDTIRHEDKYSDSDVEIDYDFAESRVVHKESKKMRKRKEIAKAMNVSKSDLVHRAGNVMQAMQGPRGPGVPQLQQLPLLNALITEIMALQGGVPTGQIQALDQIDAQMKAKAGRPKSAPSPTRETKEEREERLKKLATPRNVTKKAEEMHSHRECAEKGRPVPKEKSWVQNNPEFSRPVKKTALAYGITKAQRLRLEKTNPVLLRKLEAEQEERMKNCVEKTKAKYKQYHRETEIGTRLMLSARSSVGKKTPREQNASKLESSMQSTGVPVSEVPKQQRRPIPTPRKSVSLQSGNMKDALRALADREFGTPQEWTKGWVDNATSRSGSVLNDQDSQPSQRSVDIHLPRMSQVASESFGADSTMESVNIEAYEHRKPSIIPGFGGTQVLQQRDLQSEDPPEAKARSSRPESRLTDYNYSDNFDDQSVALNQTNGYVSGEEPSLRKIVDQYSDDSSSHNGAWSAEEPPLRKIVDRYSDDSTEAENDAYQSARSEGSDVPVSVHNDTSGPRLRIPPSMPSPMASVHSPITAMRPSIPPTREGLAASSTPTETDHVSNESTAYIRESQMPTLSETGLSEDVIEEYAPSGLRPKPSPRRKLDRVSSIHTESVSSYAPSEDGDNIAFSSEGDKDESYTDSFDDESEDSGPAPVSVVRQMSDLKLAPEARMGYTWGYSKK